MAPCYRERPATVNALRTAMGQGPADPRHNAQWAFGELAKGNPFALAMFEAGKLRRLGAAKVVQQEPQGQRRAR